MSNFIRLESGEWLNLDIVLRVKPENLRSPDGREALCFMFWVIGQTEPIEISLSDQDWQRMKRIMAASGVRVE